MRISIPLLAVSAGLLSLSPLAARAQIPQGLLQQLLPGNQAQNPGAAEQAVREAYERGYRQGRQDGERAEAGRGGPGNGAYPGNAYPNNGYQNNGQRNQYGR